MTNRETVMTWLKICGKNGDCSKCCPYERDANCIDNLMSDALSLLKEQEAEIEKLKEILDLVKEQEYRLRVKDKLSSFYGIREE